jgi:hypothetical protein
MAVRTRNVLLVAIALIGVAAAAGWGLLDLGPLHRIVVTNSVWDGPGDWQIAVDDRDRYVFHHGAVDTTGRIAFAPFAQRLGRVGEITYLPPSRTGGTGITFWIEGRRRTTQRFIPAQAGDHAALRTFAAALHDAVEADARRQDAPRIEALTTLHDLVAVGVVSNGCFGPCGIYDMVLRRNAGGTIDWRSYPAPIHNRTRSIAWPRVVRLLHAAHVERLDRKYSSKAIDTSSATLRFVFARTTYTVEAPDSSTWPPEFVAAFAGLRRLAHDTAWSPALDAAELHTFAR